MIYLARRGSRGSSSGRSLLTLVATAALLHCATTGAQLPTTPAPTNSAAQHAWRTLFETDIKYLADLTSTHYIYAVYPGGPEWQAQLQRSLAQAKHEAELVVDLESYMAVLRHFVVSFQDAHFSAYFNVASKLAKWPQFAMEYQGGRYVVVDSEHSTVRVGDTIDACGGRPMHEWIDELAEYLGGPAGLETTRSTISRQALVDRGNPLYVPPRSCRIGSRDVELEWVPFQSDRHSFERTSDSVSKIHDDSVSVSSFGANGAWVRIGTMFAGTERTASEFRELYRRAPALRDKEFVVIDVRGNGGGEYNWFMKFLRTFYGEEYADYYARARLEIGPVLLNVSRSGEDDPGFSAERNAIQVPPDPPLEAPSRGKPEVRRFDDGRTLTKLPAPVAILPRRPRRPPETLVKAKVYLLTDYGCASACISFVDEMMLIPGVVQIGAETHIDRRSGGWPEGFQLPSGLATVRMGRMVREGRKRGENEPWRPSIRFNGDIADTEAVKRWILTEVVTR